MTEQELLTKKMLLVRINDAKITTLEKPIIGTEALATCVGVLLYSQINKRAIVAHVSNFEEENIYKILDLISDNKLDNEPLKYKVITGCYYNHYQLKEMLENFFKSLPILFTEFDDPEIPPSAVQIDENTKSNQFAFNALTGKFVTDKVLFGKEYFDLIHPEDTSIKK